LRGRDAGLNKTDWSKLVRQVRDGRLTPFLGAGACSGSIPTGGVISREWARRYNYPFDDHADLARVMQYAAVAERDAVQVKQDFADRYGPLPPPDFSAPGEPHGLLAKYPFQIYLTTNYDNYMELALRQAGKQPQVEFCPWHRPGTPAGPGLNSSAPRPVVYHLHGTFAEPASMVLTEQDYLQFLVSWAAQTPSQHGTGTRVPSLIPPIISAAMADTPLLFIGYSLRDLSFLVVFHGLRLAQPQPRRHVSVQLDPTDVGRRRADPARAASYLRKYLDGWNVAIYWGDAGTFCRELRQRLDGSS
jgi:hypothetical protein